MATYTSYLNLEKPAVGETFNLLKINQNWDKIDQGVSSLNSKFTYKDYEIQFDGWSSGTIGTRAEQKQVSLENDISAYGTPVSATIKYITDSSAANYLAFLFNNLLMTNAYRANTNSMGSGYPIIVRVLFMKN